MSVTSIALLHYSVPPVVGGVESVLAQHARLIAGAGHAVRALAGRGAAWDLAVALTVVPELDSRHPRVLAAKAELDAGRVPADFERLTGEILVELRRSLDSVSILIAHNVCSLHKNLALTAAVHRLSQEGRLGRLILWHHDLAWTTPRYRAELHAGYPWDLLRTDWGARHVVVSEPRRSELAALIGLPPEAITVVPNGVSPGDFYKLEERTRGLIHALGLDKADPLLLVPVRITPRKNIELALRALAALRLKSPAAMLVVTGPPGPHNPANQEYFAGLRALRAELMLGGAAHFLAEHVDHELPDAVIADLYRWADALLLPSREEGFGIPLLEAALSRLPAFCSDIPALRDLGAGQATYFDPDADPSQVAEVILACLGQDRAYQAARRARKEFSWPAIYANHLAPLLER
ncbi:MAG: hypothetical protein A2Y93_00355 [Chloroflexi bacterium RBG_13_68_17]|nr:MAG: hypothetical protein A2Y93_00355 [Chloroflexi bacterium RBG_13_68_17]